MSLKGSFIESKESISGFEYKSKEIIQTEPRKKNNEENRTEHTRVEVLYQWA